MVGFNVKMKLFRNVDHTIHLPYAFPIVDGEPLIPRELIEYLKRGVVYDEMELITSESGS